VLSVLKYADLEDKNEKRNSKRGHFFIGQSFKNSPRDTLLIFQDFSSKGIELLPSGNRFLKLEKCLFFLLK